MFYGFLSILIKTGGLSVMGLGLEKILYLAIMYLTVSSIYCFMAMDYITRFFSVLSHEKSSPNTPETQCGHLNQTHPEAPSDVTNLPNRKTWPKAATSNESFMLVAAPKKKIIEKIPSLRNRFVCITQFYHMKLGKFLHPTWPPGIFLRGRP